MLRINRWKKKMITMKKITEPGLLSYYGILSILVESTASHMTSIQPSVVMILKSVIIEFLTLSKFESSLTHSPP